MTRLLWLFSLGFLNLLSLTHAATSAPDDESPPNILFLLTDDQRPDTIRALGNATIHTPHLDQLVREGLVFDNAYIMGATSQAVCTPSRAYLFSGRTLWIRLRFLHDPSRSSQCAREIPRQL